MLLALEERMSYGSVHLVPACTSVKVNIKSAKSAVDAPGQEASLLEIFRAHYWATAPWFEFFGGPECTRTRPTLELRLPGPPGGSGSSLATGFPSGPFQVRGL